MIRSVRHVHEGDVPHGDGFLFWTYMICRVYSGRRDSQYNLIRIDNVCERMERLGCELSFKRCMELIKEWEAKDVNVG